MSLEPHIASSDDKLTDGLHFAGRNTASYITDRRSASFAPQTASNFKPSGSKLMRFNLGDMASWLDGSTVRLAMKITNLKTGVLSPVTDSPASMFRRVRIQAQGSTQIEDIEEYGRVHQLLSEMPPSHQRYNDMAKSWGGRLRVLGP